EFYQLRRPRAFDKGTALVYERTITGGQLMLTPDPLQSPGTPLAAPIEVVDAPEEAALQFTPPVGGLSEYNFFFNKLVTQGTVKRWELFGASVGPTGSTSA